jgi:hypothetical protein
VEFFAAAHKKSLDLIFEGSRILIVALHNLLSSLKSDPSEALLKHLIQATY